jgi:deoxyribonuclease V
MPLNPNNQHPWDVTPQEARQLQEILRGQVVVQPLEAEKINAIAGVDASFGKEMVYAAAVLLAYPSLELVEQVAAQLPLSFPYIPGLLSFREAPAVLQVLGELHTQPEVLLVDGHGVAHPRRFGLACHLGIWLDIPTIGCAKSILMGKHVSLGEQAGSTAELLADGEVIGLAVRTRQNTKPVYVSVGHLVDLDSAQRIVLSCARGYRLPEPARLAHKLAAQVKKVGDGDPFSADNPSGV